MPSEGHDCLADAYEGRVEAESGEDGEDVRATHGDSVVARKDGAPGRIRTCDQWIRRPLLYPLSYGGGRGDRNGHGRLRRNAALALPHGGCVCAGCSAMRRV